MFDDDVDAVLKEVCKDIELRYEVRFIEIGTDKEHVHFLVQAVPTLSPTRIIMMIKSITAREIFSRSPQVKKKLWGGQFWTDGYYVSTVGQHGNEETVAKYVKSQGRENEYKKLLIQQISFLE